MKLFIIVVSMLMVASVSSATTKTLLDSPVTIVNPAVRIVQYSSCFNGGSVEVRYNFFDSSDKIVDQRICKIEGDDYTSLVNYKLPIGEIDTPILKMLQNNIEAICLSNFGLSGTTE